MQRVLDGAAVVLVGATGELGSRIGARLVKSGARLVLVGRDAVKLTAVGLPGPHVIGDLSDARLGEDAVATALSHYGRLDGVVNAAGAVAFGEVADLEDGTAEALMIANFLGPVRMIRAALPHLGEGAFIANLSAVVAEHPTAGMAFYSATKAALTGFDLALGRELRRRRIDVIDVRPPHTETGLAERPVAGVAPRLRKGLDPEIVADRFVAAVEAGSREVASGDFG